MWFVCHLGVVHTHLTYSLVYLLPHILTHSDLEPTTSEDRDPQRVQHSVFPFVYIRESEREVVSSLLRIMYLCSILLSTLHPRLVLSPQG